MWKAAVVLTAAVSLLPLVVMAVVDYNAHQHAIEADIAYQTGRLVSNTRRSISFFLSERKSALNFIDKDNTYPMLCDPVRLGALLENLKRGFGGFSDIGVIDRNGVQRTYVGPFPLTGATYREQDWFQDLVDNGAHVSDVFMGFRQQPHLVIAVKHDLPGRGVLHSTRLHRHRAVQPPPGGSGGQRRWGYFPDQSVRRAPDTVEDVRPPPGTRPHPGARVLG